MFMVKVKQGKLTGNIQDFMLIEFKLITFTVLFCFSLYFFYFSLFCDLPVVNNELKKNVKFL